MWLGIPLSFYYTMAVVIAIPCLVFIWGYWPSRVAHILRSGTVDARQKFARHIATAAALIAAGAITVIMIHDMQTQTWVTTWFDAVVFFIAGFSGGVACVTAVLDYLLFTHRRDMLHEATRALANINLNDGAGALDETTGAFATAEVPDLVASPDANANQPIT